MKFNHMTANLHNQNAVKINKKLTSLLIIMSSTPREKPE